MNPYRRVPCSYTPYPPSSSIPLHRVHIPRPTPWSSDQSSMATAWIPPPNLRPLQCFPPLPTPWSSEQSAKATVLILSPNLRRLQSVHCHPPLPTPWSSDQNA